MLEFYHFSQSMLRRQAGSLLALSLWCATQAQHIPCREQSFVQGQSMWLWGQDIFLIELCAECSIFTTTDKALLPIRVTLNYWFLWICKNKSKRRAEGKGMWLLFARTGLILLWFPNARLSLALHAWCDLLSSSYPAAFWYHQALCQWPWQVAGE